MDGTVLIAGCDACQSSSKNRELLLSSDEGVTISSFLVGSPMIHPVTVKSHKFPTTTIGWGFNSRRCHLSAKLLLSLYTDHTVTGVWGSRLV
jgi:hypothetical protein